MNNKIAVILALADVKYSLNDLEKHYKTFCGLYAGRNIIRGWFTANCNVSECVTVCHQIGLPIETSRKKPLKVIDFQGL